MGGLLILAIYTLTDRVNTGFAALLPEIRALCLYQSTDRQRSMKNKHKHDERGSSSETVRKGRVRQRTDVSFNTV